MSNPESSPLCTWETEGGHVEATPASARTQVSAENEDLPPPWGHARPTQFALARLGASLAHALGTPLQVISGRAALAEGSTNVEEAHKHAAIIVRKCREMSEFLRSAVANLRAPVAELVPVDVGRLVQETLERAIGSEPGSESAPRRSIRIEWVTPASSAWHGRIRELPFVEVLTSLTASALWRHTDGPLILSLSRSDSTPLESTLEITCDWSGAPLSAALEGHLCDPWQVHRGSSERYETLEFLAAYEAARQNGGSLSFPGANRFLLAWPVQNSGPEAAGSPAPVTKR